MEPERLRCKTIRGTFASFLHPTTRPAFLKQNSDALHEPAKTHRCPWLRKATRLTRERLESWNDGSAREPGPGRFRQTGKQTVETWTFLRMPECCCHHERGGLEWFHTWPARGAKYEAKKYSQPGVDPPHVRLARGFAGGFLRGCGLVGFPEPLCQWRYSKQRLPLPHYSSSHGRGFQPCRWE